MRKTQKNRIKRGIVAAIGVLIISSGSNLFYHQNNVAGKTEVTLEFEEPQEEEETNASNITEEITLPGYETIKIAENETEANVNFYNPDENPCNLSITITLNKSNEVIYESKLLAPGQHLYKINLNKTFESGTYDVTLTYQTFSLEDNSPLNGAQMELELNVN